VSNTCGGTPLVNGNIVTLQNGALAAGATQCTLVFQAIPIKCERRNDYEWRVKSGDGQ